MESIERNGSAAPGAHSVRLDKVLDKVKAVSRMGLDGGFEGKITSSARPNDPPGSAGFSRARERMPYNRLLFLLLYPMP